MIAAGVRAIREMYALTRGVRNLRVLMMSNLVATLAAGLLNPVLPIYLRSRGLAMQDIGLVYTCGSLLPIFLQPVLGSWSDRYGRRGFIIGLSMATSLLVPLLALVPNPTLLAVAIALKLLLIRSASPITGALVADSAPQAERATVFALLDAAVNLMFVVALASSSLAVRWLSTTQVFFLAGVLWLAGSLVLFRLEDTTGGRARASEPSPPEARAPLRLALHGLYAPIEYARRSPVLAAFLGFQFFFIFALNLYPIYIPLYAVKLGAPRELVGPLVAVSWLVFALFQPLGGRLADRMPRRGPLMLGGLTGMALISLALGGVGWLPTSQGLLAMGLLWALLAVPDGLFRPALSALSVELAPPQERGRFMGALGSCAGVAQVLAPVSYGFVADHFSLHTAFLLSSSCFLLAMLALSRLPSLKVSPSTPLTVSSEPG